MNESLGERLATKTRKKTAGETFWRAFFGVCFVCLGLCIRPAGLNAEERVPGDDASGFSETSGASSNSPALEVKKDLSFTATTLPEAIAQLNVTLAYPLLRGGNALTASNGIQLKTSAIVTPVSVRGALQLTFTPVAFLQLHALTFAGSGWNMLAWDTGLSLVTRKGEHDVKYVDKSFEGLVWGYGGAATFQFDFAALFPGEWNHVVVQSFHRFQYRGFTGADDDETWAYECDWSMNRNGWNYYGNVVLGYQMPMRFHLAGLIVEADKALYKAEGDFHDGDYWGQNLPRWTFGILGGFRCTDTVSLSAILQFRTTLEAIDGTDDFDFYQDRKVKKTSPYGFAFYRLVGSVNIKL